jgi:hypothetical protein
LLFPLEEFFSLKNLHTVGVGVTTNQNRKQKETHPVKYQRTSQKKRRKRRRRRRIIMCVGSEQSFR